jgi:hypothetical protein
MIHIFLIRIRRSFTVSLSAQPAGFAKVEIPMVSSNGEAEVINTDSAAFYRTNPAPGGAGTYLCLEFNRRNWNVPRTVR